MKQFLSLTWMILTISACGQNADVTVIDAEVLLQMQADGVPVVDVRTSEEVKAGKIPGAFNVTLSDNFAMDMREFDKEKPVIVYCRSGRRSTAASQRLVQAGYKAVYNYSGSYSDWTSQKRAVE